MKKIESTEQNILGAIISELPQGVLICNAEGQVLLFNRRARELCDRDHTHRVSHSERGPVLGRSITRVIDKNLIEHALEEINERLNRNVENAVSHFVVKGQGDHVLRSQVVPILDRSGKFTGFIIILNDITHKREYEARVDSLLQSLTKSGRSPLASIRAAIEAMLEFPDIEGSRLQQFKEIIHKESITLSNILNQMAGDYASLVKTRRSLTSLSGADLIETLRKRARDRLGIVMQIDPNVEEIWVRADNYSLLSAILFLLNQLKNATRCWEFGCRLERDRQYVNLDLCWRGRPINSETLRRWEDQYLVIGDEKSPLTLKEVIQNHEAALWPIVDAKHEEQSCIRFLLRAEEGMSRENLRPITILPESHIEFYDFDLLGRSGSDSGLDSRLLTELSYTVLIREVFKTNQIKDLIRKHAQLPELMHHMITSGAKVRNITRLITIFSDAVLKKVIEFALAALGPPPVNFAFITLGSEGRKEQTLKTDQDNAIVYEDIVQDTGIPEQDVQNYFIQLGEKICTWLDQAGYNFCSGNVMAQNPKWCQPISTWKAYFSDWIYTAEAEDLLHASIFFDFRFTYGDPTLVEHLSTFLFNALGKWSGFFRHMAQNAVYFKPPIGFLGNFVVESKGEHRNCLNIKHAIRPIVDYARIYALKNNIRETNTQERLYRIFLKKGLVRKEYNEIEQAYDFMMQLRFVHQIKAVVDEQIKPDNYINPKELSRMERKMLAAILKKVESVQKKLNLEFLSAADFH